MRIIPEPLVFEWDKGNELKNLVKHGVSIQETEEVFGNEPLVVVEDLAHSEKEQRFEGLGITNNGRRLFVCFTVRNDKIRIISVRDMSKKEKKNYEKV